MELKEVIEISRQKIIEAHNAFYAGHPDVAKSYLVEAHNFLRLVTASEVLQRNCWDR